MLPKKYRLTKREDFAALYSKGAYTSVYDGVAIKYLQTENSQVRLGFPIGKGFSKKAVERNRARRILRAASFSFLSALKPGYDIAVMPRTSLEKLSYAEISAALQRVFSKANLFM